MYGAIGADLLVRRVGFGAPGVAEAGRGGFRREDERLVTALYYEHGRSVLAYATRLTNDRVAAEDITQEVLVRAWRNADSLSTIDSVRGWLLTVTRNVVVDRLRAKSARPREVAESEATPPVSADHGGRVATALTVSAAVRTLPAHFREVLVEVYYRGSRPAEVARDLGIPEGTVRSRLTAALRALRAELS